MGGTGAMGIYLIPLLKECGYEVHVTTRSHIECSQEANVKWIVGNAKEITFLNSILQSDYDAIVDFMIYSTKAFRERINLLLSRTKQYVFIYSYRVFAGSQTPLTERSPRLLDISADETFLATDTYSLAKARQEDILKLENKNNWTIVRPSITYSKNRLQLGNLETNIIMSRGLQGLPVLFPEEMLNKQTTMTWAGDVAKLIMSLIGKNQALSNDFNVVTNETKTWAEVYDIYKDEIGLKLNIIPLEKYMAISKDKYQIKYVRMFDRVMDNTKILTATNLKADSFIELEVGLRKEIKAFINNPVIKSPNYSLNGRFDRISGTRISLEHATVKEKLKYLKNFLLT